MTYTTANEQEQAVQTFQQFGVDDRLALMWYLYDTFGGAISQRDDTDTAGYDASEPLIPEIQQMLPDEQLQVMRDLLHGKETPITLSYSQLGSSDQMAFWYRLAQSMDNQAILQVPADYQLSPEAQAFLNGIKDSEFEKKVVFFRNVISRMGISARNPAV